MKSFVCVNKCTFGNPPRLYSPGDVLLIDAEKPPRHFKDAVGSMANKAEATDAGKTLADAAPGPEAAKAAVLAAKTAPESCMVGELAEKLGVDAAVIKEAAGKSKMNQKLTADEVSAVMAAVAKAAPAPEAQVTGVEE